MNNNLDKRFYEKYFIKHKNDRLKFINEIDSIKGRIIKFTCPKCGEDLKVKIQRIKEGRGKYNPNTKSIELPENHTIIGIYTAEPEGIPWIDEIELSHPLKSPKHKIWLIYKEGEVSWSYTHSIELLLDKFYSSRFAIYLKIFIASLILFSLWSYLPLLLTGHIDFFPKDFYLVKILLFSLMIVVYIYILNEIKTVYAKFEKFLKEEQKVYIKSSLYFIFSGYILLLTFMVTSILYLIIFQKYECPELVISGIIGLSGMFILSLFIQTFAGLFLFLYLISNPFEFKQPNYYKLNDNVWDLSKISMRIIFFTTVAIFVHGIYSIQFINSQAYVDILPSSNLAKYVSLVVFPISVIFFPFIVFIHLNHRLMAKVKVKHLNDVRDNVIFPTDISEISKLRKKDLEKDKMTESSEISILNNIKNTQRELLNISSFSTLMMIEEKINKATEWPINLKMIGQILLAISLGLIPFIIDNWQEIMKVFGQ